MSVRHRHAGGTVKCRTIDKLNIFEPHADLSSVAAYDFEGNVTDTFGSFNGSAVNITYDVGKYGQGAVFNGVSSNVTLGAIPALAKSNSSTISVWVKISATPASQTQVFNFSNGTALICKIQSDGKAYLGDINNGAYGATPVAINNGNWQHLVLVRNSNNTMVGYLNGNAFAIPTGDSTNRALLNTIGSYQNSSEWFNGSIDQMRIFNKALTQAEIEYVYNTDLSAITQIKAWDGCSIAAYDFENNANDLLGTYNGTPTNITYTAGKYGNAAVFNGSNSKIATTKTLDATQPFSISFYIKTTATGEQGIYCSGSGSSVGSGTIEVTISSGKLYFNIAGSSNWAELFYVNAPLINDNTFKHIVIVHTSAHTTGANKAYIDGVPMVLSGETYTSALVSGSQTFDIGWRKDSKYFNGSLDQVRIFNRALTATEVQYLYNNDVSGVKWMPWTTESGVALYRLDGNTNDESGNYHGTETNVTYGGGVYERGMICTSSNKITIPYSFPEISSTNNFAISIWIKRGDISTSEQNIFSQLQSIGGAYSHYLEIYNNLIRFAVNNSTTFTISAPMDTSLWHHIVISRNSTILTIYLDGVASSFSSFPSMNYYNVEWRISSGVSTLYGFNGSIDQVRLFNRAVTATEVATLYEECAPTSIVDNIDPFDDGSLKALYQFEDNANDATGVYNGAVFGSPTYVTGRYGQSITVGGTNYITSAYNSFTLFSLSFLVKFATTENGVRLIGFDSTGGSYMSLMMNSYNSSSNRIELWNSAGASVGAFVPASAVNPITTDRFYHLVLVKTSATTYELYIDGIKKNTVTATLTMNQIRFGATPASGGNNIYLDQVRIFNKALTPMEVASLYNETTPLEEPLYALVDPFKDGSGKALYRLEGNALDESGNYNGTATNVAYGDWIVGRCGVFNGSSSVVATDIITSSFTEMTVSLWFKTNTNMISLFNGDADRYTQLYMANTQLYSTITGSEIYDVTRAESLNIGEWYHATFVYKSGSNKFYINGSLVYTQTDTFSTIGSNIKKIGSTRTGPVYYANGSIDQVRFFNRALTQEEITTLYTEGA